MTGDRKAILFGFLAIFLLATSVSASPINDRSINLQVGKKNNHPKIESVLSELLEENEKGPEAVKAFAEKRALKVKEDGRITVYIVSDVGEKAEDIDKEKLKSYGVEVIKCVGNTMKATLPINMIRKIADEMADISFIRLPDVPYPQTVTTEGLNLTGAYSYHSAGYTGAGVGIAIIDKGFLGVCAAALAGEIPGSTIFIDCTGSLCINKTCPWDLLETTSHGTAVAEIIHDMAPDAQLYLLKIDDPLDAVTAYSFFTPGSVNIVNYSVGWANQNFGSGECFNYAPFYDYNPVCLVNDAYATGILWVNSAGNSAKKHYAATFTDSNDNSFHDTLVSIQANYGDSINIYLTWDAWPATDQDYDLYLLDSLGYIIAMSQNWQTGTQKPTEQITTTAPYFGLNTYYVAIKKTWATGNHKLNVSSFDNELSPYVASGSLLCPADAATAFSVGAIDLSESTWSPAGQIASYSSQGPTSDGRIKPEIVGPSHVSTYSWPGFNGTSAAAPHVAGAAAIILSANPGYTVSQLGNALISSALDMGTFGQDNIYGYGRLNMPTLVSVTVTSNPSGRQIVVDGTGYTAPQTFIWTVGSSHAVNVISMQAGSTGIQYVYSSWSDGGAQSHAITTPASNATYTANFTTQYRLTTSINPPGSGTITPNCSSGCWYNSGASVSLSPTPTLGNTFFAWTGDIISVDAPISFTMNAPRDIIANFDSTTVTGDVRIMRIPPLYFPLVSQAYADAVNNDLIEILAGSHTFESLTFDRTDIPGMVVTLKGGYNSNFSDSTGLTILGSPLTIQSGIITLDRIVIE